MNNEAIPEIVLEDKDLIDLADRLTAPEPKMRKVRMRDAIKDPSYRNHAEAVSAALELAATQGPSKMFERVAAGLDQSRDHWLGLR